MCPSFPAPRSCLISTAHQAAQRSPSAALARGHQYPCWLPFNTTPQGTGEGLGPTLALSPEPLQHCTSLPLSQSLSQSRHFCILFCFLPANSNQNANKNTFPQELAPTSFPQSQASLPSHSKSRQTPLTQMHQTSLNQSTFHHLPGNGDVPVSSRVTGLLS